MGLIKVRATNVLFNGGPNKRSKSIWAVPGDREFIADEDRGLKNIGDVFMVDEKNFSAECMVRLDPPAPKMVESAPVDEIKRGPGRPRKVVEA